MKHTAENIVENKNDEQKTTEPILVTGASGNVGREVVKSLCALGYPVRAAAYNKQDAPNIPANADEIVFFDFGDPDTYVDAFDSIKKMFLMRPPAISDVDKYIKPVIDYAAEVGVQQIAFLSLMGVEKRSYCPITR